MNIVVPTCTFKPGTDIKIVLKEFARYGFKYVDLSTDYCIQPGQPLVVGGWKEWAYELKETAESLGLSFYQAHGIGTLQGLYNNPNSNFYGVIDIAEILGIKWIVMHPNDLPGHIEPKDDEYYAEENARLLRPYFERCVAQGVGVAVENLPWANSNRFRTLKWICDIIDSPYCGVCVDTGHANINQTRPEEIEIFGDKLVTMHAQDNHGTWFDEHLIPFYGTYDWKAFMESLRKINYKGEFVLEAHHQTIEAKSQDEVDRLFKEMKENAEKILTL